jgi:hypothetical protein
VSPLVDPLRGSTSGVVRMRAPAMTSSHFSAGEAFRGLRDYLSEEGALGPVEPALALVAMTQAVRLNATTPFAGITTLSWPAEARSNAPRLPTFQPPYSVASLLRHSRQPQSPSAPSESR